MGLVGRSRLAKQLKRLKLVNEQPFVEKQDLKYSNEGMNNGLYLTHEIIRLVARLVILDELVLSDTCMFWNICPYICPLLNMFDVF